MNEQKTNEENSDSAFLIDLLTQKRHPVTVPRCRVGRDKLNDIIISGDESISRFHFQILMQDDSYFVKDTNSQYGTFLNGKRIILPEIIKDKDVLKLGVSLLWFEIQ